MEHYYVLSNGTTDIIYIEVGETHDDLGLSYHSHCNIMYHIDDAWDFIDTYDDVILLGVF